MSTAPCPHCGEPMQAGQRFCGGCGGDVSGPQGELETVKHDDTLFSQIDASVIRILKEATAGRYEILHELGRGGMAIVYYAREIELDRPVAIKVMSPELGRNAEQFATMMEKFKQEARTAAGLSHLHIIPIYTVGEHKGLLYFAMKFVSGRALDSIIKEKRQVNVGMAEEIIAQVAAALDHAHERGVIHRDIKPSNIMIDGDGLAVVTDFGIAKQEENQNARTGTIIGTPEYMSPEQCLGKTVDGRPITGAADQYSLGVAAYEMIAGRRPIIGDSPWDTIQRQLMEEPPPIERFRPDCPPYLRTMIHRMIAKDPDHRYPSLQEVVRLVRRETPTVDDAVRTELLTLARSGIEEQKRLAERRLPATPPPPVTPDSGSALRGRQPTAPARKPRRVLVPTLAASVVLAGVGIGYWQWKGGFTEGPSPGAAAESSLAAASPETQPDGPAAAVQADSLPPSQPEPEPQPVTPPPVQTRTPETQRPAAPPRPTTGRVVVTSLPPNGRILIDGQWQPSPDFRLPPRRYAVTLAAEGYVTDTVMLDVIAGEVHTLTFSGREVVVEEEPAATPPPPPVVPDSGTISVIVNPRAELMVGGRRLAEDRSFTLRVPAGTRNCLRFLRDAYLPLDTAVSVAANETLQLRIRLTLGEGTPSPRACGQ